MDQDSASKVRAELEYRTDKLVEKVDELDSKLSGLITANKALVKLLKKNNIEVPSKLSKLLQTLTRG